MAFPCKPGVGGGQLRLIQVNADRARLALARWCRAFSIPLSNGWSRQATSIGIPTAEVERGADAFIWAMQVVL